MTTNTTRTTWLDGDVVQTHVPYDDFPVTILRIYGTWKSVLPSGGFGASHLDEDVDSWLRENIAHVAIRQEAPREAPRSERSVTTQFTFTTNATNDEIDLMVGAAFTQFDDPRDEEGEHAPWDVRNIVSHWDVTPN